MPSTPMKNLVYRAALPFLAPSVHKQLVHHGDKLVHLPYYEHILTKHHVQGASLLLSTPHQARAVCTGVLEPRKDVTEEKLFRVASITKMATALVTLMCIDDGLFDLESSVASLLPDGHGYPALEGITIRHLLSHTSSLQDTPAVDAALQNGHDFGRVLSTGGIRIGRPGECMSYCNFGFGLIGCILENVTGMSIESLFRTKLFQPLGMRATLDASTLNPDDIVPITRVLPYRPGQDVTITKLGSRSIEEPDPLRHFGHTAGAMYTDAASVALLLQLIGSRGVYNDKRLVSEKLMTEMISQQAATPTRKYGLGLVLLNNPSICDRLLLGHQGFAYGCVDGAFIEPESGSSVVFLNGGASEARIGKLGLVNRDVLHWALNKEMPAWK